LEIINEASSTFKFLTKYKNNINFYNYNDVINCKIKLMIIFPQYFLMLSELITIILNGTITSANNINIYNQYKTIIKGKHFLNGFFLN